MACIQQLPDSVRTDVTGSAGNEYIHDYFRYRGIRALFAGEVRIIGGIIPDRDQARFRIIMAGTSNLQQDQQLAAQLCEFIGASPTPFHAVANTIELLQAADYTAGDEGSEPGAAGKFYLTQNDSSLIAVSMTEPPERGFALVGAHTDSPCLKVKPNAAYTHQGYLQLGVEVYGGALLGPWFDRDLSLAGRVTSIDRNGILASHLIDFRAPLGTIPSLAIHLNREVNQSNEINAQKHLPPLLDVVEENGEFETMLLEQLARQYPDEAHENVLAFELSLYDVQAPALIGRRGNLVSSARLDNLLSCYLGVRALLAQENTGNSILVLSDHEEVGSASAVGAAGPFLETVLRSLCGDETTYRRALRRSLLVSADNAHAVHPNYADRHEPRHQPRLNQGPVIKINHNQRYATNSETQAIFKSACRAAGVPYQPFVVRSDMGCGSTIGPITATELGIRTIDVGAPQLAMHSVRELAGVQDCGYLLSALTSFYNRQGFSLDA